MDPVYSLLDELNLGAPDWLLVILAAAIPAAVLVTFMALAVIFYVYAERKIAGFMQDRLGPMRVGKWGLLQTIADALKLMMKEAIFPRGVDPLLFVLGPCLVVLGAFLGFVVLPFGPTLVTADLNIGIFYVVAVSSLSTVGLIMAGWASNNKYALYGAMRSAAQIVSYEIPSVVSLLTVILLVGSLSLQDIVLAQAGGLGNWFAFRFFPLLGISFLVFFIATLAECNRAPFDIPEAESELVAGFHTEYSGFFFAMFFMAEYTEMFVLSAVGAVLFLGGWMAPIPALQTIGPIELGPVWLIGKAWALVFVHMWLRWTVPRLRVDQLMHVAWKVLLPIALVLLIVIGGLALWEPVKDGFGLWDEVAGWIVSLGLLGYLAVRLIRARQWQAARIRELAA